MNKNASRLVYSSERGRICPSCSQPAAACRCRRPAKAATPGDGVVRVGRATRGRKGKGVTTISGVPLAAGQLKALASELKQQCGTGGTLKDGVIELQGDHRDQVIELLKAKGLTVKRAGG